MQLLPLTAGLSLLSAVQAVLPSLTPARAEELVGTWYVIRWAGDLPIPNETKTHAVPPFSLARNKRNKLEFRTNVMRPIGCIRFKLHLDIGDKPGTYQTRWKHIIYIYFLPGKNFCISYFSGYMNYMYYQIILLLGRKISDDPEALRLFQEFLLSKEMQGEEIIKPKHADFCQLSTAS